MHNAQDVEPVVITTQTGQQQQHAGESLYLSLSLSPPQIVPPWIFHCNNVSSPGQVRLRRTSTLLHLVLKQLYSQLIGYTYMFNLYTAGHVSNATNN